MLTLPTAREDCGRFLLIEPARALRRVGVMGGTLSSVGGSASGAAAARAAGEYQPLVRVSSRYSGFG